MRKYTLRHSPSLSKSPNYPLNFEDSFNEPPPEVLVKHRVHERPILTMSPPTEDLMFKPATNQPNSPAYPKSHESILSGEDSPPMEIIPIGSSPEPNVPSIELPSHDSNNNLIKPTAAILSISQDPKPSSTLAATFMSSSSDISTSASPTTKNQPSSSFSSPTQPDSPCKAACAGSSSKSESDVLKCYSNCIGRPDSLFVPTNIQDPSESSSLSSSSDSTDTSSSSGITRTIPLARPSDSPEQAGTSRLQPVKILPTILVWVLITCTLFS